jgi:hypothetical protein
MAGHGLASQGLAVRTLFAKYDQAGKTLTRYTEVWVAGADTIQESAPGLVHLKGLWIGLGLPRGGNSPMSQNLELWVGPRGALGNSPPNSEPNPGANAQVQPVALTQPNAVEQSLDDTFGNAGRWWGFEIAPGLFPVPAPTEPDVNKRRPAMFFRWTIGRYEVAKRSYFLAVPIVATLRPNTGLPAHGFQENFVLGISLLTREKAAAGADLDYYDVSVRTWL